MKWWKWLLDYFTPASLREEPELAYHARLVAGVALLGCVFGTSYATFYFIIGHLRGAWIIVVCTTAMITVPWLMRATGWVRLAGCLHAFIWTLGFSGLALVEGGVHGHAIAWLASGVPLLALLILDLPTALLWCAITFLATLSFCALELFHIRLPLGYPAQWHSLVTAVGYAGFALFLTLLGILFETSRKEAFKGMQAAFRQSLEDNEAKHVAEGANRAKDEFIAVLSHELRTPLTPILMITASMDDNEHLPSDLREDIRVVRQNVELEARLIDDLLDLTRVVHGKYSLRTETVDLHELIGRTLGIVQEAAARKDLHLRAELRADRATARADPARLQQVFWNLLNNAIKFTANGGEVEIRTCNSGTNALTVEVRDTGVGIPPESVSKIFRPFEQGALGGNHRYGGLGLGLAISKAIVELHGGQISASSAGVNLGSMFTIDLPVVQTVQINGRGDHAPLRETVIPQHILLVEDNDATRNILARLLSRDGHNVQTAGTCAAAIEEAHHQPPDSPFQILVSDLGLPDGSGLSLVREVKAELPAIKAIALSGYGTEEDVLRSMEAGFHTHLTKPITIEALRQALAA